LPGKLDRLYVKTREGTEPVHVGGRLCLAALAKGARNALNQALLPLEGQDLNRAGAARAS